MDSANPASGPWSDRRLRQARVATYVSLAFTSWMSCLLPIVGLSREPSPLVVVVGSVGVALFALAHAGAQYAVVTPWLAEPVRRRLVAAFAVSAVASVPLVGPVGAGWPTWAWIGASLVGIAPLLARPAAALGIGAAATAVSVAIALSVGGDIRDWVLITAGVGAAAASVSWLQLWFWDLLVQASEGRAAQARLAATEERLRFARDVHDVLGHSLAVIAVKAELAARLAPVDGVRAGEEAADVRRLAASALAEVREVVHGYRAVDLPEQLTAVEQVLRASGVRCTVDLPPTGVPADVAHLLGAVVREASTNVLRHSRAGWCTIEVGYDGREARVTVTNDGAVLAHDTGDRHSFGLRGLAERLAEAGGTLRTTVDGDRFELTARVPMREAVVPLREAVVP